jgi:hypothetical protein
VLASGWNRVWKLVVGAWVFVFAAFQARRALAHVLSFLPWHLRWSLSQHSWNIFKVLHLPRALHCIHFGRLDVLVSRSWWSLSQPSRSNLKVLHVPRAFGCFDVSMSALESSSLSNLGFLVPLGLHLTLCILRSLPAPFIRSLNDPKLHQVNKYPLGTFLYVVLLTSSLLSSPPDALSTTWRLNFC